MQGKVELCGVTTSQLLTLSTCGDIHPDTDARFALLAVRID